MRIWELANGIHTPLSGEEDELLKKLIKNEDEQLSEREEVVANQLVQKDVLVREEGEDFDKFRVNWQQDYWRD